jgi:hypothetical protein
MINVELFGIDTVSVTRFSPHSSVNDTILVDINTRGAETTLYLTAEELRRLNVAITDYLTKTEEA